MEMEIFDDWLWSHFFLNVFNISENIYEEWPQLPKTYKELTLEKQQLTPSIHFSEFHKVSQSVDVFTKQGETLAVLDLCFDNSYR